MFNNNDILNDYDNDKMRIPDLENAIPKISLGNYNPSNVITDYKFTNYEEETKYKKQKDNYLLINNYYLKEEDKLKKKQEYINEDNYFNNNNEYNKYLGDQNISFYYFCKIMKVFSKNCRPEVKIKCNNI